MIRSLPLTKKLIALGLIGVCSTLVTGLAGYQGLTQLTNLPRQLDGAVWTHRAQMNADMMHRELRAVVATARLEALQGHAGDELITEAAEKGAVMLAEIDTLRSSAGDSVVREAASHIRTEVQAYTTLGAKMAAAAFGKGGVSSAQIAEFDVAFSSLEKGMGELGDKVEQSASALSSRADRESKASTWWLLAICASALVAVATIAVVMIRAIRTPLAEIARHAASMATGDFSKQIDYRANDEIGSLADSLRAVTAFTRDTACAAEALSRGDLSATLTPHSAEDVLVFSVNRSADTLRRLDAEISALIAAGAGGNLTARANATAFEGTYRTLVNGINKMLDETLAPISEATKVLAKVANRDLRVRVVGTYNGDHARLTTALNTTLDQLEVALREVLVGSQEVTAAAEQIAAGSQTMAEGASDQASALEEINASLQELSSLSYNSSSEAKEVQRLTEGARATAEAGVEHMHRLNDAMDAIHKSVGESARIMRTIDEIAFQTNLLALNAAVEAARAGDAGRGFAVVADEVRSLAMRSAEEARRSAAVIERSMADAARGIELKELTRAQLVDLACTVAKVSLAMQTIAQGSEQQSDGIRQILAGTDQMNRVTQQSAANAEESAAAAQELTAQAESLSDLVGRFDISEGQRTTGSGANRPQHRAHADAYEFAHP